MGHGPRSIVDKPPAFKLLCNLATTDEEDALTMKLLAAAVRRDWAECCVILNTDAGDELINRGIIEVTAGMDLVDVDTDEVIHVPEFVYAKPLEG